MPTHSSRSFALALVAVVVTASWASQPPNEVTLHAGYDAKGGSWSVVAGRSQPLVVVGSRTFAPTLRSPLDYLSLRATVDGDTVWIADGSPRVVSVALTDGALREMNLPVPRTSDIAARGGLLFAGFYDADLTGVLRFDPVTGRSERVYETKRPNTLLAIGAAPGRVWIATWTGLNAPRARVDLIGIPSSSASKEPLRRATRELEWAAERFAGFSVQEDEGGNVWIAHTYAGKVERLDPSGVWTSWTVAPDRLVSLATIGSRAVALVATMDAADPLAPPGIARGIRSQSLVVIDPSSKELARTNVVAGTPIETLAAAGGHIWIAKGREIKIVAGRAVLNEAK